MATLKDIAEACGVSAATVSYVLNGRSDLKLTDETKRKVRSMAERLGYEPNALARSVRKGYANVLALVVSTGLNSDYFYRIFNSICRTATEHDFSLKVFSLENGEDAAIRMLREQRVAGAIFHAASIRNCRKTVEAMMRHNVPTAAVNFRSRTEGCASFASDDRQGAFDAVCRLHRAGCRKIACMTHRGTYDYIRLRREGYCAALETLLPGTPPFFIDCTTFEAGTVASLLSEKRSRPDGIFCIADDHAFHLYQTAYRLGIRIPEELSVIGFGNLAGASDAMVPLSSVRQDFEGMGRLAAEAVISAVLQQTGKTEGGVELPASVLERESVAKQTI